MDNYEREACQELVRRVHAPKADITIHPFGDHPSGGWIGSWWIGDAYAGNIWHDADGWHVSINLPTDGAHAELSPLSPGIGLPTSARIVA